MPDDPELEADIFKELDNERQARLLKTRSATEVMEVLARMRTDDAAGGLMALEFIALSENLTIRSRLRSGRSAANGDVIASRRGQDAFRSLRRLLFSIPGQGQPPPQFLQVLPEGLRRPLTPCNQLHIVLETGGRPDHVGDVLVAELSPQLPG